MARSSATVLFILALHFSAHGWAASDSPIGAIANTRALLQSALDAPNGPAAPGESMRRGGIIGLRPVAVPTDAPAPQPPAPPAFVAQSSGSGGGPAAAAPLAAGPAPIGGGSLVAPRAAVAPQAVCSGDTVLFPTGAQQQVCKAFLNTFTKGGASSTMACTVWFIDATHVVTAGHCIADGGAKAYKLLARNPGLICCRFGSTGSCAAGAAWRILRWVSTNGWMSDNNYQTDAAVLKVSPASSGGCINGGAAQNYGWWSATQNITGHIAGVYGFPMDDTSRSGCSGLAVNTLYGAVAYAAPVSQPTTGGLPIYLPLPVCAGMSGALVKYEQTDMAYGILSSGANMCNSAGRSTIGVTQITQAPGPAGVNLAALVNVIP